MVTLSISHVSTINLFMHAIFFLPPAHDRLISLINALFDNIYFALGDTNLVVFSYDYMRVD